jgi:hypothetical protein
MSRDVFSLSVAAPRKVEIGSALVYQQQQILKYCMKL